VSNPTEQDGELICAMCYPDILVYGEVMPGWVLSYHPTAHRHVPAAHYALFNHHHEPCFWWPHPPVESTADRDGDAEAKTWADDDPRGIQEEEHVATVTCMGPRFKCAPEIGHALVEACIKAGWDQQNSGMPLFWLVNRMARLIAASAIAGNRTP